ncbi:MAG: cytochrome b/b6 domain-containing protein, partial [Bacteroidetes bacterium]|nr:cytochrome b/b6 domain-containing protein [Bacteroidota bacterium]
MGNYLISATEVRSAIDAAAEHTGKHIVRFSRLNRILHIMMIVSFISLAFTGMTLKFAYTGWASILSRLLGGFESAGYIHRVAAVVMFGLFVAHVIDLVRLKRKEFGSWKNMVLGPNTMIWTKRDFKDIAG